MAQNRFESSIAAASESALTIAQPTTASLASVYGPSVTVNWPLRCWMRLVRGSMAPVATSVPFRKLSSTNPAISALSSGAGGVGGLLTSGVVFKKNFMRCSSPPGWAQGRLDLGAIRHARLHAVLVECRHPVHQALIGQLALLGVGIALDQHHDSHLDLLPERFGA